MKDENKAKAEQITEKSEIKFKELFNNMSSGVAVYEAKNNERDFIIKDFNRAGEKIDKDDTLERFLINGNAFDGSNVLTDPLVARL